MKPIAAGSALGDRIKKYVVQMLVRRGAVGITEAEVRRARPEFPPEDLSGAIGELEAARVVSTDGEDAGADGSAPHLLFLQPVYTLPAAPVESALMYLRQAGDEADFHEGCGGDGYRVIAETLEAARDALNERMPGGVPPCDRWAAPETARRKCSPPPGGGCRP